MATAETAEIARLAEIAEMRKRALQHQRESRIRMLNDAIAGRDLVATTLSTPNEVLKSQALCDVVLGRAPYFRDEDAMVRRITKVESCDALITLAANPEDGRMPVLLDAWKLIVCDLRYIEEDAKWFIPVLEELAKTNQLDKGDTKDIWKQVSPAPPAWIQQIVRAQQPWGFVVYKTSSCKLWPRLRIGYGRIRLLAGWLTSLRL